MGDQYAGVGIIDIIDFISSRIQREPTFGSDSAKPNQSPALYNCSY